MLFLLLFSMTALADISNVKVTLLNQDPDPVEPGQTVEVRYKVENLNTGVTGKIAIELLPEYPFNLLEGETAVKEIGSLQGYQTGTDAVIIKYKLRVDQRATEGTSELKLRWKEEGNNWISLDPFDISVKTVGTTVEIKSVRTSPEQLSPGEVVKAFITLENIGNNFIKDVSLNLDLTLETVAAQLSAGVSAYGILPFAPVSTSNEQSVKLIEGGDTHTFVFELITFPDAASGVYKVPVRLTYYDMSNNKVEKTDVIGFVVGTAPELSINLDSSDVYVAGTKGTISISIANKGISDAKFMNVKLIDHSGFNLLSKNEIYIGNVDSDDFETIDFDVYVSPDTENELLFPLVLEYKDANSKAYQLEQEVRVPLYTLKEAQTMGLIPKQSYTGLIIVAIAIIAFAAWRIVKRKKH